MGILCSLCMRYDSFLDLSASFCQLRWCQRKLTSSACVRKDGIYILYTYMIHIYFMHSCISNRSNSKRQSPITGLDSAVRPPPQTNLYLRAPSPSPYNLVRQASPPTFPLSFPPTSFLPSSLLIEDQIRVPLQLSVWFELAVYQIGHQI